MANSNTKCLLVTANVGSIFEDPDNMLKLWLAEFLSNVADKCPAFVAIHCQEVGGKNYEESMQHVNIFVKSLLVSDTMQQYDKARIFLDEDFTAVDKFTALGSLYFIHQSVQNIQIWDFKDEVFKQVAGQEVYSGNIENVSIKEKAKFPQEFFPNQTWSRKGFIRTRWNICDTVFDLVNIHLFHDASNLVAMENSPSEYSSSRKNALLYTIERFETDQFGQVPYFIFGDFNFRLDLRSMTKSLTEKLQEHKKKGKKNEVSSLIYSEDDPEKIVLTIGKKSFEHTKHHDMFYNSSQWLRSFDHEPCSFSNKLLEYPVSYPPSYPFSEDVDDGMSYMKTRCPSWCDRILFSHAAKTIILEDESLDYGMMGRTTCMGDHKPVYLNVKLRHADSGKALDVVESSPSLECTEPNPISLQPSPRSFTNRILSINGENVNAAQHADINIHDFSTFEHEQLVGPLISSTRQKLADDDKASDDQSIQPLQRPSFRSIAKHIMTVEHIIRFWYNHRSDTENDSDSDDDARNEDIFTSTQMDTGGTESNDIPIYMPGNNDSCGPTALVPDSGDGDGNFQNHVLHGNLVEATPLEPIPNMSTVVSCPVADLSGGKQPDESI